MVAWKGTQKSRKEKSAMLKFRMKMLVALRDGRPPGRKRPKTTNTNVFPTIPRRKINPKSTGTITTSGPPLVASAQHVGASVWLVSRLHLLVLAPRESPKLFSCSSMARSSHCSPELLTGTSVLVRGGQR